MAQIYDNGTYLDNNPTWHEEASLWKARQIKTIIDSNALAPNRICEVGCGAGEIPNELSNYYSEKEFHGYEISPQAFELCKSKSKVNLTFLLVGSIEKTPECFDVAMAIDVLEHVEDYRGFLKELREKAEYKILHIPLDLSVQTVLRSTPLIKGRRVVGHIHYFTKDTAMEILRKTGYTIIDYFYTGSSMALPTRKWRTRLLRILRQAAFAVNKDLAVRVLGGYSLLVLAK